MAVAADIPLILAIRTYERNDALADHVWSLEEVVALLDWRRMGSRIIIVTASVLFFIPAALLALVSPHMGGGEPQYGMFLLTFPFMGSCPFPVNGNANTEADLYYWPVFAGLAMAGLGVVGLSNGKLRYAAIFVMIMILCWALTLFRFIVLNERVYN
jgi:hypothetical protein